MEFYFSWFITQIIYVCVFIYVQNFGLLQQHQAPDISVLLLHPLSSNIYVCMYVCMHIQQLFALHIRGYTGANLGLLAGGSQPVIVICRSTYEPGGGGGILRNGSY